MKTSLHVAALVALWVAATAVQAAEDCPMGPGLDFRDINFRLCEAKSGLARSKFEGMPSCLSEFQRQGGESFDKLKTCMRKRKNTEGLRALGEYRASWNDVMSDVRTGTLSSVERKRSDAEKKLTVLETLN